VDANRPNEESVPRGISVRLFGELEFRLGGDRLPRLESARARSLLAFLLLHRDEPQPRQRLAFMLWPESSEAQARTNLRHLVHTLRQTSPELDQFLDVTAHTLQWRGDGQSWIDVAAFDAAHAAAEAPGITAPNEVEALRDAIDLYRGDLLDGCYDEWVLDVRDRFRERYLSHLRRLAEVLAGAGELAEAIRVARELQRKDPLREETTRFLMQAHVAAGDRAAAARTFHECVSTLQRELGVHPSPETVADYERLARGDGRQPPEADPVPTRESPLVGRDDEWSRLLTQWRATERGGSHFLLITGEPGAGKTRLLDEFTARCAHGGALVASARSYQVEGNLGFDAAISWLRCREIAVQLQRMPWPDRLVLGRLLPDVLDGSDLPTVREADASEDRRRLFETLARVFATEDRTVMLVVDDVQWCDEQTAQLMHYLVTHAPTGRLLIVATARTEDIDESPAGAVFAGLQALDRATEIPVGRLSRREMGELARNLLELDIEDPPLDELFTETEGNPLFIVETIRAGWSPSDRSASNAISPKLQAVIGGRLRQLSASARELLGVAATVGREFRSQTLGAALGRDDVTLVGDLDEVWRRGIIREHGIDSYDFTHGKIRDVAYHALSAAAARHNHRRIAGALLAIHADAVDEVSGEVARHLDRAGQPEDAIGWYRRAAEQAQRVHADAEAIRLLERSLDLVALLPAERPRAVHELEVLSALVTLVAVTDGFASSRLGTVQARAIELSEMLGREPEGTVLRSAAMSMLCGNDFPAAGDVARRLRHLADAAADPGMRIESEYLLGIGSFWSGSFDRARDHFREVIALVDPTHADHHRARFGHDARVVCLSRLATPCGSWALRTTRDERATTPWRWGSRSATPSAAMSHWCSPGCSVSISVNRSRSRAISPRSEGSTITAPPLSRRRRSRDTWMCWTAGSGKGSHEFGKSSASRPPIRCPSTTPPDSWRRTPGCC
jgi:DNA-binding SARP family transcriptional activator